jgi:hypothetical protein
VNLKSVNDSGLFANAAASRGSPFAGVKDEIGSKLTAIAGARFLAGAGLPVANAGDKTSPAAARAVTSFAVFDPRTVNKSNNSLFVSRYSHWDAKVP